MSEPRFLTSSNLRTIKYLVAAIVLEALGIFALIPLLIWLRAPAGWLEAAAVALPGAVYTVFIPALRDLTRGVRTAGFVFLTAGVGAGLAGISGAVIGGDNFLPTFTVSLVALLITAFVAYVDWEPGKIASPRAKTDATEEGATDLDVVSSSN